jgi:hypothetical protein
MSCRLRRSTRHFVEVYSQESGIPGAAAFVFKDAGFDFSASFERLTTPRIILLDNTSATVVFSFRKLALRPAPLGASAAKPRLSWRENVEPEFAIAAAHLRFAAE